MKKLIAVMAILAMVAVANAGTIQKYDLELVMDSEGVFSLHNTTDSAVRFYAYSIESDGDKLSPTEWISIQDQAAADMMGVFGVLGMGGVTMGEMNPTSGALAEYSSSEAVLQAGASFAIGKPATGLHDLKFYWANNDTPTGDQYQGNVVPEPATMALLGIGGLAAIIRRRKA